MRRIMLVLSLVAMLGLAAVPAVAQDFEVEDFGSDPFFVGSFNPNDFDSENFEGDFVFFGDFDNFDDFDGGPFAQEFEQEDVESGDVEPVVDISNTGNNANLCPTVLQSSNTGNIQNAQGVVQYQSEADDIEFEGSNITIASEASGECTQTIEQAVAVW